MYILLSTIPERSDQHGAPPLQNLINHMDRCVLSFEHLSINMELPANVFENAHSFVHARHGLVSPSI